MKVIHTVFVAALLVLFLFSNKGLAQTESGEYYLIGVSFGFAQNGSAYGYRNVAGTTYDLTYYSDAFLHHTGYFRYMKLGSSYHFEADAQMIGILFTGMRAMWLGMEDRHIRPSLFSGTGRFLSLNRHLAEHRVHQDSSLTAYGTDFSFFNSDLMWGENKKLGIHLGINGVGTYQEPTPVPGLQNSHNFKHLSRKLFWSIGPAMFVPLSEHLFATARTTVIISMKNNGNNKQDHVGTGIELYPSLRYVSGNRVGWFFEAFLKLRRFGPQGDTFIQNSGTGGYDVPVRIQSYTTSQIGISGGLYLSN
ncbi:MAG: hypothetical protein AAF587_34250 [Bacteroidota bacterium]